MDRRIFLSLFAAFALGCGSDPDAIQRAKLVELSSRINEALKIEHDGKKSRVAIEPTIAKYERGTDAGDMAYLTYVIERDHELIKWTAEYSYHGERWVFAGLEMVVPTQKESLILIESVLRKNADTDPVYKAILND